MFIDVLCVYVLSTETDLQCTQNPEFTYTYIRRSNSNYGSGLDSYHTSTEIVHRRRERGDQSCLCPLARAPSLEGAADSDVGSIDADAGNFDTVKREDGSTTKSEQVIGNSTKVAGGEAPPSMKPSGGTPGQSWAHRRHPRHQQPPRRRPCMQP
jgi:hypothetical protein